MVQDVTMRKLLCGGRRRNKIYRAWEKFLFESGKKPRWVSVISMQESYDQKSIRSVEIEGRIGYSEYNLEDLVKNLFDLMKNRKEVSDFSLNLEKNLELITLGTTKQILQKMLVVNFSFSYYKK